MRKGRARGAAPEDGPGPFRRPLAGMHPAADGGVEAVGPDQQGAALGSGALGGLQAEDGVLAFGAVVEGAGAGDHRLGAEAGADGLQQGHLEAAAVDGILRPAIAGLAAAGLGPDLEAVLREQAPFAGGDADFGEDGAEAHLLELAHRVGLEVDAHAEGAELPCGLEHAGLEADLVAGQGEG